MRYAPAAGGGIRVDGVLADGTPKTVYVEAQTYYGGLQTLHSAFLEDASYIKMTEARMGYDVPIKASSKSIKSLNVSLTVRNPWLIYAPTKKWGVDPAELESPFGEGGQLPQVRSFGINVSVGF